MKIFRLTAIVFFAVLSAGLWSCKDPLDMGEYGRTVFIDEKQYIYFTVLNGSTPSLYMICKDSTSEVFLAENAFALGPSTGGNIPLLVKSRGSSCDYIYSAYNFSSAAVTGTKTVTLASPNPCTATLSSDSKYLLYPSLLVSAENSTARYSLLNLETGNTGSLPGEINMNIRPVFNILNSEIAYVKSADNADTICSYDSETGSVKFPGYGHFYDTLLCGRIDLRPDALEIIAPDDGTVFPGTYRLLGYRTDSTIIRTIYSTNEKIYSAKYSPDGTRIALATESGIIIIDRAGNLKKIVSSETIPGTFFKTVEWELSGNYLLSIYYTDTNPDKCAYGSLQLIDLKGSKSRFINRDLKVMNAFFPSVRMVK